jgi:formate dehydrogenase maturation protein FdhE
MTKAQTDRSIHAARIQRAQQLAERYSFAREVLEFYQQVAIFQSKLQMAINATANLQSQISGEAAFHGAFDGASLIPHVPEFLSMVTGHAPRPLAESARQFSLETREFWIARLVDYWNQAGKAQEGHSAFDQFLPRAFLQPYIELRTARARPAASAVLSSACPLCGSRPLLGVLRPEGDGGRRFLVCSFCSHEWAFRRILCAWCGEEDEKKLPVYVAEEFPHIKVETCETCKCYLRTIDLTKDGHAVPMVDDLAAIPLSLWAEQQGYSRPEANLLGT